MKPSAPRAHLRLRRIEPVLRRALRGARGLTSGDTLLVAVSGGADSVALLVALHSLAHEHGLLLHAAHLHHGLRGAEADADRAYVRTLCAGLGVPLSDARIAAAARMRTRGLAGEAGLRTLRREWLQRVAKRVAASAIATAHTADDQLETLLLRLARGTGLAGAAGMQVQHGRWWKPLLEATRADVEADLVRAGIAWRDDASNATRAYTRNRIRHDVVPALLDAVGTPAAAAAPRRAGLARRAQALARELGAAHRLAARAAARAHARLAPSDPATMDRSALARLAPLVARLVFRRAWAVAGPQGPGSPGLTARHLDGFARALARPRAAFRVALPDGWQVVADRESVRLLPAPQYGLPEPATVRHAGAADARLRHRRQGPSSGHAPRGSQPSGQNGRPPRTARR